MLITLILTILNLIPCNAVFARNENVVQVAMELDEKDMVCVKAPGSLNAEPLSAESPKVEGDIYKRDSSGVSFSGIITVIVMLVFLYFYIRMFRMVYEIARRNNRDPEVWLILSLITTPIVTLFLLRFMGDE